MDLFVLGKLYLITGNITPKYFQLPVAYKACKIGGIWHGPKIPISWSDNTEKLRLLFNSSEATRPHTEDCWELINWFHSQKVSVNWYVLWIKYVKCLKISFYLIMDYFPSLYKFEVTWNSYTVFSLIKYRTVYSFLCHVNSSFFTADGSTCNIITF